MRIVRKADSAAIRTNQETVQQPSRTKLVIKRGKNTFKNNLRRNRYDACNVKKWYRHSAESGTHCRLPPQFSRAIWSDQIRFHLHKTKGLLKLGKGFCCIEPGHQCTSGKSIFNKCNDIKLQKGANFVWMREQMSGVIIVVYSNMFICPKINLRYLQNICAMYQKHVFLIKHQLALLSIRFTCLNNFFISSLFGRVVIF